MIHPEHGGESYWQPRVMRHVKSTGEEEVAIHEVYFTTKGDITGYTRDALSMRETTVERLREKITQLLDECGDGGMTEGDLGYTYDEEDVRLWLDHIDDPVTDYEDDQSSEDQTNTP